MKLIVRKPIEFLKLSGQELVSVKILAGSYSVRQGLDPLKKTKGNWIFLNRPARVNKEFKGHRVGVPEAYLQLKAEANHLVQIIL